jgi:quercetin dioxygenase-like cupin family protein
VKVFEVEPDYKENTRISPAVGSRTEGEQDFETSLVVFPPGRNTALHTHSSDQLLYIIAGKGVVGTESEQHLATPGKVFLTPKGQPHFQAAAKDCTLSFLYVLKYPNETVNSGVIVPITVI